MKRGPETEQIHDEDMQAQFAVEATPGARPFSRPDQPRPRKKP